MAASFHTLACEDRDFVEWHQGSPWCAVWVLRMESDEIVNGVAQARASVAQWLLPRYERQPHITLAYRGLMPAADGSNACAEFGVQQLQADIQLLQSTKQRPWLQRVQGVGSFPTVPYLAVELSSGLQHLHASLTRAKPYPGWRYVPHITLGHYGCVEPIAHVLQCLQGSVSLEAVLALTEVNALWLARYRTNDIAGPLYFEGHFDLHTQQYVREADALLNF